MFKICFFKERLQCLLYICRVNVLIINVSGVAHTSLWTRYWQGSVHTAALPPTTLMQLVKRHGAAQEVLYGAGPQTNSGYSTCLAKRGPKLQTLPDTSCSSTTMSGLRTPQSEQRPSQPARFGALRDDLFPNVLVLLLRSKCQCNCKVPVGR